MKTNNIDRIAVEFAEIIKNKLKGHLKKIVLFGSHARGDFTEGSDFDVLIIVDKRGEKVQEVVLDSCVEIMDKYYALVGCIVCDEKEWKREKNSPIGLNILKEGIEL